MPDIETTLAEIAAGRRNDPLAPVTVVVPSHIAALQLRRRLAEAGAFAAVRFEALPRLAELLAAGHLAAVGRVPLARPIGDYTAGQVALESRGVLGKVRDLPGYARSLRQAFRRLRRGGIRGSGDVNDPRNTVLSEVLRLYDLYRSQTAAFYDEEDLFDEAAAVVRDGRSGIIADLGAIYLTHFPLVTAGTDALVAEFREGAAINDGITDAGVPSQTRLTLAPDPASEAREVVREVISAMELGIGVHEIAVFHGTDSSYPKLLREAFQAARIPTVTMPGTPLSESRTGRAVLALLNLPNEDFSRTRTMDFFSLAPLRDFIPASEGSLRPLASAWDKTSRAAGVTRGRDRWAQGLTTYVHDAELLLAEDPRVLESESRQRMHAFERDRARDLGLVVESLIARLDPLTGDQPASRFIASFNEMIKDYIASDAEGYEDVLREVEQLGTVDAVGGSFNLHSFHEALRANLESGVLKESRPRMGDGILVADYRMAAALRFRHVVLCGAFEGALPAGPGADPILGDQVWSRLREEHPFVEDAPARIRRGRDEAALAVKSAAGGTVVWSCPLYEPGATRDFYPSPMMVAAATGLDPEIRTATQLRRAGTREWLRRSTSPISSMLNGSPTSVSEVALRTAVNHRNQGLSVDHSHPQYRSMQMLSARRSNSFTEWDGNLATLAPSEWLTVRPKVSPTSLEHYATCGFRYFCRSLLGLTIVDEPEERETIDAAARGSLVHDVLERFFARMKELGRPQPGEPWTEDDRALLLQSLDSALGEAKARGLTGREVYSAHDARVLRADLIRFLEEDNAFRAETGAVPSAFEAEVPEQEIAGVSMRGRVDRVDVTPDGKRAWIIDYKTGSSHEYKDLAKGDPLGGGSKLQLPVYLAAAGKASEATALYWFITHRGGFERIEFDATPENKQRFRDTVEAIVEGVRTGAFPASSGEENDYFGGWNNCRFCDFDRVCSRRRDQEHSLKSSDAAMGPWFRVTETARPPEALG